MQFSYGQQQEMPTLTTSQAAPNIIKDSNLKVELVAEGLEFPTTMAFLDQDDILVLEKNNGTVQRIVNGVILPQPLLDVNVANKSERGMLGIAVANNETNNSTHVFIYFTESLRDGNDDCPEDDYCNPGNDPLGNRLYRYELVNDDNNNKGDKLANPSLLLDLPAKSGPAHNGGAITIGPDNNVYLPIGELRQRDIQNISLADGRGGILRVTQDGEPVVEGIEGEGEGGEGILGNTYPLNLYYAYGIRNSYGIDFDPVTGNLWDTENGPGSGDEINLVEPGFNSGWNKVQGIWPAGRPSQGIMLNPDGLLEFGGKAKYSAPEFTWTRAIGPTAIKFLNSDNLGKQYQNDIFVADVNNGNIYHFDLNEARTGLVLQEPLADKVADIDEYEDIIFGQGFGSISDLEVGPDGYLYVVSIGRGAIYRIVPGSNGYDGIATTTATTTPSPAATTNITKLATEENKTANVLYHYEPYMTFRGDNFFDNPSNSKLQLTNFTTAFWFRTGLLNTTDMNITTTNNATTTNVIANESRQFIVNKGGSGTDMPGKNMNYGMYISTDDGEARAGFEGVNGARYFVSSVAPVNDTQWHYAVTTYDGSVVRLYIDGIEQGVEVTDGAIPDNTNNTLPLRIGANSNKENRYFIGDIDEVRIWNRALTPSEVKQAYEKGVFNVQGQVVYLPFESPLSQKQTQSPNQSQTGKENMSES